MHINILDWSYDGIRGVNNLEIKVERKKKVHYPVSLIMMPNGTGKTTTINLLRAILNGSAINWSPNDVIAYRPNNNTSKGKFQVKLLIDNKLYYIILELNYETGKASYKTSRVGNLGGLDNGLLLPSHIKSMLTVNFVKRFVFDGELAKEIISSDSREAERAILYLYQLNKLEEISSRVDDVVINEQKKNSLTAIRTNKGLSTLQVKKDIIETTYNNLRKKAESLKGKINRRKENIKKINDKLSSKISENEQLRTTAEDIEKRRNKTENEIVSLTQNVLSTVRNPTLLSNTIASNLRSLSNNMEVLKLPKTMSQEFFKELAEQDICICGNQIAEKERENILGTASNYLAEDELGVINAIKSTIRNSTYNDELTDIFKSLKKEIIKEQDAKSDWDRLQAQLRQQGDAEVTEMQNKLSIIKLELQDLEKEYNNLITKDKNDLNDLNNNNNIHLCKKELENVKAKIAEATNTVKLLNQSDKLKKYLDDIKLSALNKLKIKIQEETNKKLSEIIKTEKILVESIDGSLKLKNKSGASEGQTLAIAYSFLGSMFESSSHQLPFIVDSPAGSLDLNVRREVSAIIPELFNQLIIFITSGEREAFANNFYNLGNDVQFLTISKKDGGSAILNTGQEFFKNFQGESD